MPDPSLIPNLAERESMLREMGLGSIEELFADIPREIRARGLLLPPGRPEAEVLSFFEELLAANRSSDRMPTFLGAGLQEHYVPSAVRALLSRGEFYTSYTPYQPEVSQGMLSAMFEFQSFVCELTGMDAANISMYDHATALGEAALLSARATGGRSFLVPASLSPSKREVLANYAKGPGLSIQSYAFDPRTGRADLADLAAKVGPDTAGVYLESPNTFGVFEEEAPRVKPLLTAKGNALLVVGAYPLALGVQEGPGAWGADVVIGEMGGLGSPIAFGGPLMGMFAARAEHLRRMPGRIVGLTTDSRGNHGFCLTLQAREQHIRREKATSNICTNQTLLALASTIFLSMLGGKGLADLAARNLERAEALKARLAKVPGVRPRFTGATFNEFVLTLPVDASDVSERLPEHGVHGGVPLGRWFPGMEREMLLCTTELHTDRDHERLEKALRAVLAEVER